LDDERWRAEQEQKMREWKENIEHELRNGILDIESHCRQAQKADTEEGRRYHFEQMRARMSRMEATVSTLDSVQFAYEQLRKGCYK